MTTYAEREAKLAAIKPSAVYEDLKKAEVDIEAGEDAVVQARLNIKAREEVLKTIEDQIFLDGVQGKTEKERDARFRQMRRESEEYKVGDGELRGAQAVLWAAEGKVEQGKRRFLALRLRLESINSGLIFLGGAKE